MSNGITDFGSQQTNYIINQQSTYTNVVYNGLNINVHLWSTGVNYTNASNMPPSSVGTYFFSGHITNPDTSSITGTGALTILPGSLFFKPDATNIVVRYDGEPHYIGYGLRDSRNITYGDIFTKKYFVTATGLTDYTTGAPINPGSYIQIFYTDDSRDTDSVIFNNYYPIPDSQKTASIQILCGNVEIVPKSLVNPYTSFLNPINLITFPPDVNLNIKYNNQTGIPIVTGKYKFFAEVADSRYCYKYITGIYSINGISQWETYGLAWGSGSGVHIYNQFDITQTGLYNVQKIGAASGFGAALMQDNTILTWGADNSYGQQNIPALDKYIKDITVSNNTIFIIDWSGSVTGCGYLFNTLGNGYSGGRIPILTGISGISAADYYALAIPKNQNGVTGWGDNSKMQFNYSGAFGAKNIKQIECKNLSYVLLNNTGSVSGFGLNTFGQLSWNASDNKNIKKITCSDYATVFLYKSGTITGYGQQKNSNNQFSQISFTNQASGIQGNIVDVSIGKTQILLITNKYFTPPEPVPIPPVCTGVTYA